MNVYLLDGVLAEVNVIRRDRGLPDLVDLPKGVPGDRRECCLARALSGGRGGAEWAVVTGDPRDGMAASFVMFSASPVGDRIKVYTLGCRGDEVPELWWFQRAFDAGGFPDLVDWPDGAERGRGSVEELAARREGG